MHGFKLRTLIGFAVLSAIAIPKIAAATVTINGVNGASYYESTGTFGTTQPTIYGGTAGLLAADSSNTSPFSTCAYDAANPLKACNERAISGNVVLNINFKSTTAGYPVIRLSGSSTTVSVSHPGRLEAAGDTWVSMSWQAICTALSSNSSNDINPTTCEVGTNSPAKATFSVGVADAEGGEPKDKIEVQIVVQNYIGQAANGDESTTGIMSSGEIGLNEWEIRNGDAKVVLDKLDGTGIPGGAGLTFRAIRVIWTEISQAQYLAATGFADINSATPTAADLTLKTNSTGGIEIEPARVEGLENDRYYAFKVAMVDLAGNIGYYTATAADTNCDFAGGGNSCHLGHPGEVVGVLSADLNCFIATAAYGSTLASQVELLREFRDRILRRASWGRKFIEYYYERGPEYARFIAANETGRAIARVALWPAVAFAWLSLQVGLAGALAIFALSLCAFTLLAVFCTRLIRQRKGARA